MKILFFTILCGLLPVLAALDTAEAVTAAAPGTVFLQGEELKFSLKPAQPVKWILRNWQDQIIRQGEWTAGPLVLAALPNGYYKLELAGFEGFRSFVVVPDPGKREHNPDQFFAMDSAQSWLARPDKNNPRQPQNPYEVVSEVARRSGVQMVRERLSWIETEPVPGQFDWKQYKTNADLLSARGVEILGMYHHAPEWTRKKDGKLPVDLLATYRYAKKAAETFRGQMTVWEFWNEQDIGFSLESAWDYAAAFKAASLGFKAADPKMPVAIGGYAMSPILPYADVVMQNGAGEYFDIFNIHTYRSISEFPDALKSIREHLRRNGIAGRPIWFTENGSNMEGAGRTASYIPGLKTHSPDQEMLIAEYLPKMMITMQSLGVARDFFFVLPPYNEGGGNKDWGLMRRDFTVKPGYAAFATLADRLGSAALTGEVKLGDKLKGYLYRQKNGTQTLVFWSISELDTDKPKPNLSAANLCERNFALPLKGEIKGVDLFGTPFTADASKLTATRYPAFLDEVNSLKADIPFKPAAATISRQDAFDKTVIFRTELSEDFKLFVGKDCADIKRDPARFKLQIWNLSEHPKTGAIRISGGETTGTPAEITLPPFGKTELDLSFTPRLDKDFKGGLQVDGTFGDRKVTPLVIPLQSLKEMSASGQQTEMPQMLDPANWRRNSSGKQDIGYDEAERAIYFTTLFPAGVDRWTYPEYILQLPQESLKGALGVSFEVKVSKASAVKQMLLMAVMNQGQDVYLKVDSPAEAWQERFVAIPPTLDPAKIVRLRLGVNSHENEVTLRVRNIRVFYGR